MDIEKLAEMTAKEFGTVHAEVSDIKNEMVGVKSELADVKDSIARIESSQRAVLEAILEIPTKKSIEWLADRVECIDERVTVVERKLQTAH